MRLILLLFLPVCLFSQTTLPELKWSVLHPFAALKVIMVKKQCDRYLENHPVELTGPSFGGNKDAFRHLFYMSAIASKIGAKKSRKLGVAHEKGNFRQWKKKRFEDGSLADSLACVMDLRNNDTAIALTQRYGKLNLTELYQRSLRTIIEGRAWMLLYSTEGKRLNCNKEIIYTTTPRKWFVEGCLVCTTINR